MDIFTDEGRDKIDAINGEINTSDPENIATIDMTNPLGKNWKKLPLKHMTCQKENYPLNLKGAYLFCYSKR